MPMFGMAAYIERRGGGADGYVYVRGPEKKQPLFKRPTPDQAPFVSLWQPPVLHVVRESVMTYHCDRY